MAERVRRIPVGDEVELPASADAERAVLGCLLVWPAAYRQVRNVLTAEYFEKKPYRIAFETYCELAKGGEVAASALVSALEVTSSFPHRSQLWEWASGVQADACVPAQLDVLVGRLRAVWQRRQAVVLGRDLLAAALDAESNLDLTLHGVVKGLRALSSTGAPQTMSMAELLAVGVETVTDAYENALATGGEWIPGFRTGLAAIDRQVLGLHPGNLCIIGARPAMGKSALALDIALGVASHDTPVHYISREDRARGIALRLFAKETGVEHLSLRLGRLETGDLDTITKACNTLTRRPIRWDFQSFTLTQICNSIRRIAETHGTKVVFLDYLQLVRHRQDGRRSTSELMGEITKELLAVGEETGVSLVVFSQLSREVEKRNDKRPIMADLRDSGEIEQDAHSIAFLYRPAVYWPAKFSEDEAWLLWRKVREGKPGDVKLRWRPRHVRFEDWELSLPLNH